MKVVLLTSDYHVTANIGLKSFLDHPGLKKHDIEVVGIVMANQFSFGKKHLKRTAYFFKKANFVFLAKNIITNIWKKIRIFVARYLIPNGKREYYAIDELAEKHDIPFLEVESLNSEKAHKFIKEKGPDLMVSCFLLEILKKEVLSIPKKGSINVHPALVQKHRGAFSAFWAIAKNWNKSGATVHYMTEGVDDGDVIVQKHFFVYPSDTVYTVNKKAARLGGKLLVKALINIKKNRAKRFRLKKLAKVFTFPNPADLKRFYAQGKSLFNVKDIFGL
jgi:folate-dependent phosphoribosylglycinamide formyltransferase PurN